MSTLLGTLPPPIIESIRLEPPGKLTVIMSEVVADLDPPLINIPECPVQGVVATGYEMQTDPQGGFGKIVWTFMGGIEISEGEGSGGEEFASPKEVIELSIGVDQVPLGMHPHISDILKDFGGSVGESGELTFPEEDPTGQSRRTGVNAEGEEFALNPFYGVTSFFSPRATFRIRRLNQDGGIGALGKLDDPPLSGLSSNTGLSSSASNWIKTSVNRRDHGSVTETTEEWLYSLTGWESRIYDYA